MVAGMVARTWSAEQNQVAAVFAGTPSRWIVAEIQDSFDVFAVPLLDSVAVLVFVESIVLVQKLGSSLEWLTWV